MDGQDTSNSLMVCSLSVMCSCEYTIQLIECFCLLGWWMVRQFPLIKFMICVSFPFMVLIVILPCGSVCFLIWIVIDNNNDHDILI